MQLIKLVFTKLRNPIERVYKFASVSLAFRTSSHFIQIRYNKEECLSIIYVSFEVCLCLILEKYNRSCLSISNG